MSNKKRSKKGGSKTSTGTEQPTTKKVGTLAAIIDPMLLAGGSTIQEIAAELAKKAGEAAQGKDLAANVRARMVSYTRKGWKVQKDEQKRVQVLSPVA